MIWVKTVAGLAELKKQSLVESPVTRNLLMVIDGIKTQELLLKYSVGVTAHDFRSLHRLRLIEPRSSAVALSVPASLNAEELAATLKREVALQFGLAGMVLTGEIDGTQRLDELQRIARQVLERISATKGEAAAKAARKRLFG